MTHDEIATERAKLDRQRREMVRIVMAEYDQLHGQRVRELREECGKLGHRWSFTHFGPLGTPWYGCGACHTTEARDRD